MLTMTVFKSGQVGSHECLDSKYGMDCISEQVLPSRELNPNEIKAIKSIFGKITVETVFIPAGTRIESAAPCVTMAWDNFGASDHPPALGPSLMTVLPEETVVRVTDLLLQLK